MSVSFMVLYGRDMAVVTDEMVALETPRNINVLFRQLEEGEEDQAVAMFSALPTPKSREHPPLSGLRGKLIHQVAERERPKQPKATSKNADIETKKQKSGNHEKKKTGKKEKSREKHTKEKSHGRTHEKQLAVKEKAKEKSHITVKKHHDDKKKNDKDRKTTVVQPPSKPVDTRPVHNEPSVVDAKADGRMVLPKGKVNHAKRGFDAQDLRFYPKAVDQKTDESRRRVALLGTPGFQNPPKHRRIKMYPADFTDNTQLYGILDSGDERIKTMERREPLTEGECVPMQDWQTTFHPSCNGMHELDMENMGEENGDDYNLFGTKGYWRNAWRVDSISGHHHDDSRDTIVLKTLK